MSNPNPEHSRFGGSSAYRWTKCPYSAGKDRVTVDKPGAAAKHGTMLHQAAETLYKNGIVSLPTPEDRAIVEGYVKYIRSLDQTGAEIECRVKGLSIHDEAFGTTDFTAFDGKTLVVVDLKTGAKKVTAEGNMQLLYYAVCYEDTKNVKADKYKLVIWQNGAVEEWCPPAEEVVAARFAMRAAAGIANDCPPTIGSWCDFCKVKDCPAKAKVKASIGKLVDW